VGQVAARARGVARAERPGDPRVPRESCALAYSAAVSYNQGAHPTVDLVEENAVRVFIFLLPATLVLVASVPAQRVLEVPKHYPTIQAAIDAAQNNDTVLVAPGRYLECINYNSKSLIIRSARGPLVTTIDGNQAFQPVVKNLAWGIPQQAVLEGFTITNGRAGGVLCDTTTVVRGNIITGNYHTQAAGGITGDDSVKILGNIITSNVGARGGGIAWYGSRNLLEVKDNLIADNFSVGYGGGIAAEGNGDIENNVAAVGGGIGNDGFNAPNLKIAGNVIRGNIATQNGGGIASRLTTVLLDHNTIAGNYAHRNGGGLHLSVATMSGHNNILWDNRAYLGDEASLDDDPFGGSVLTLSFSVVKGGQSSIRVGSMSTLNWGAAMATVDPAFVDLKAGDVHLRADSPYVDKGDSNAVVLKTDVEGDPRTAGLNVDIGADEFHPHLYAFGRTAPGIPFDVKAIGPPSAPVIWAVSLDPVPRTPPISIPGVGNLCLGAPFWVAPLGVLPASGNVAVPITLPPGFPVPLAVPMQALIGTKLSNLEIVWIR